MFRGLVNARHEAVVRLRLRGPTGIESDTDAIVDSGFTASLTLPVAVATSLDLARQSGGTAVLADGSVRQFDICAAELEWGGTWRPILVSIVGDEPLLGMRLLVGHKLIIEVKPGGLVEINPLPGDGHYAVMRVEIPNRAERGVVFLGVRRLTKIEAVFSKSGA